MNMNRKTQPSISQKILEQNKDRDPSRLALKMHKMSASPFAVFRAQAPLFYEQLQHHVPTEWAPCAWLSGDAHLENIGSYTSTFGNSMIDITDFDEAHLGPVWIDPLRFATSLDLAVDAKNLGKDRAVSLMQAALTSYKQELSMGKARWLDSHSAQGLHLALIHKSQQAQQDQRSKLRIEQTTNGPRLKIGYGKTTAPLLGDFELASNLIDRFNQNQVEPFTLLDVGRRASGLGSLGQDRFAVLLQTQSGQHVVCDVKGCPRGSYTYNPMALKQPHWNSEAHRVASIQMMMQAQEPPLLGAITLSNAKNSKSFLIKELLPTAMRLDIEKWDGDGSSMLHTARQWGRLISWGHLRASGRQGADNAQILMQWAHSFNPNHLVEQALEMAQTFKNFHVEITEDPLLEPLRQEGARVFAEQEGHKIAEKLALKKHLALQRSATSVQDALPVKEEAPVDKKNKPNKDNKDQPRKK